MDTEALSARGGAMVSELRRDLGAWRTNTPRDVQWSWVALAGIGGLTLLLALSKSWFLRDRRVLGGSFARRLAEELGKTPLDREVVERLCREHPSCASRVALAGLKRWGRSTSDIERGVAMAQHQEAAGLRRGLGTIKRLGALSSLVGVLSALLIANHVLHDTPEQGPSSLGGLGACVPPLILGVTLTILTVFLYDRRVNKAERHANALERLGAQVVDALAQSGGAAEGGDSGTGVEARGPLNLGVLASAKNSKGLRIEIPEDLVAQRASSVSGPKGGAGGSSGAGNPPARQNGRGAGH